MTKNINPFSLERRLFDQSKYEMFYMLWKDCMPCDFYKFICKKENFSYLNSKNVLHPKVSDIVWSFTAEDENNYKKLRENLGKNKSIFQYVYLIVYPEIYCPTEKRGFYLKSQYLVAFKEYKDKKAELGKDPKAYQNRENVNFEEQKPILIDDFTKEEEEELKKIVEPRK